VLNLELTFTNRTDDLFFSWSPGSSTFFSVKIYIISERVCVCDCVREWVSVRARKRMCACVRACVRARVHVRVHVSVREERNKSE